MQHDIVTIIFPDEQRKTIHFADDFPGIEKVAEKIAEECASHNFTTEAVHIEQIGPREWEAVLDRW